MTWNFMINPLPPLTHIAVNKRLKLLWNSLIMTWRASVVVRVVTSQSVDPDSNPLYTSCHPPLDPRPLPSPSFLPPGALRKLKIFFTACLRVFEALHSILSRTRTKELRDMKLSTDSFINFGPIRSINMWALHGLFAEYKLNVWTVFRM